MSGPHPRPADAGDDAPLAPELAHAVAALRPLPPASPDAVARVLAQVNAATVRDARPRAIARVVGALGALAAGVAFVLFAPPHPPPHAPQPASAATVVARAPSGARATPTAPAVRLARSDAATADLPQVVRFRLVDPQATTVAVVGDFNQWNARATPLARDTDGTWGASVALTPGRHAYRFVVDDARPVLDPRAPVERDAELGVSRSVVVVGVP